MQRLQLVSARASSRNLSGLGLELRVYFVATIHRTKNSDNDSRLKAIRAWLAKEARKAPIAMPLHLPMRNLIRTHNVTLMSVRPIHMASLVNNSTGVSTGSVGLQKEACFHRVRCVTLRDETEWVETIDAGRSRLRTSVHYAWPPSDIPVLVPATVQFVSTPSLQLRPGNGELPCPMLGRHRQPRSAWVPHAAEVRCEVISMGAHH